MTSNLTDDAGLTAVMERALRDAYPADDPGPAAMAAGRRLRRRRRAGLAAGGLAAVTAVVALAVPLVSGPTGSPVDSAGTIAAARPSSTPGAATPTPDPDHPFPGFEFPRGWWDMPSDQMLAALEVRLPAGVRIVDADPPGRENGSGDLSVLIEGPNGTGRLGLMLRPRVLTAEELPDPVTTTDADGDVGISAMAGGVPHERNIGCRDSHLACELIENAAGDRIGDVSTEQDGGTTYHNADLLGPDGGAINLYVADSTGDKPGYEPPSATAPPLTLAQVRALVQDPIWTSYRR